MEKKLESKPSRTSILKPRKSINQSTANESNPDITIFKDARRVSFATINSVKPFVHDPEKNTIWDNTYEEEVNHTDSTKSNDHIETKEILDMSNACLLTLEDEEEINISLLVPGILESNTFNKSLNINIEQCDKENYVPNIVNNPFLTQDSVKFSDSVFMNNTSMQLTGLEDMELTGVASKSEPTQIKESRMQISHVSKNKKPNVIQDMQVTCVSSAEDKLANHTNQDIENMQMTCINDLDASMQLTSVNPAENVTVSRTDVQDMQLTCVFPTKDVEHDPKNVAKDVETSMQLTCDYSKDRNVNVLQDMQLTCVSSMGDKSVANITDQVGETMEFTCIAPQSDTIASNNIKDLSPTDTRSMQSKTIIFDDSDMQLTDVIAKEIINKVQTSLNSDIKLQTSQAVMFKETNMNITSAMCIEEDMDFTCAFNDINNPVLRNEKSVSAESSSSTNRLVKNVNFSESFKDQNISTNISNSNLQKSRSGKQVPDTSLDSKVDENSVLFKETNMNKTSAMSIEEDMEYTCSFNDINKHNPVLRNEKSVSAESSCSSLKNQHISTNISNSSLQKSIHDKTPITEKNVTNTSKQLSRKGKPVPETLLDSKVDPKSVILDTAESFKGDKEFSIVEYCNSIKRKENLNTFLSSSTEKKLNENHTCSNNSPLLLKEPNTESNNSTVKHIDKHNLVHSTNDSCTEGESLDLKSTLEETSDKVEPHFSFAIYRSSTLVKKGDKKELDQVELDAGITTEHEHEQVLGKQNYKLTPEALSIDYTPSTSFAMIINNSRFVEHPEKKINSTKPPLYTSKRDDELEGPAKEDAKAFESDNNSEINVENNDLILSDSSEHAFTNTVNNGSMLDTSNIPLDFLVQDEETEKAVLIPTNKSDVKSEMNSLNFTSSGLNSSEYQLLRLFQDVQELLALPKVEVPKISEDLLKVFKKLEETQQSVAHRLENLKFSEVELIDLEELDKLEDDFDSSNTSRFSDVVSANSADDNIEEETGLLDIEVPKSLEERVKEAALRSEKYWEFAKSDADYYCFYTFSRAVPFTVRVRPDSGLVDEIQTYPNLQEDAAPYLYYLSKYLQEKLKYQSLLLVLGDKFDVLALLDYVCICMEEVLNFSNEFDKLVEEYGRTHKFRMESDFTAVVEVINREYAIWWTISIEMSITNLGQPGHVKATHTLEEVDEKRIQSLMENTTGPSYLRDFIIRLDRYVQQEGKRIVARRKDEFQLKFESNWTFI